MKLFCFLIIIIFLISCHDSETNKVVTPANNISDQKQDSFFPVTSFLKGQLAQLIKLPVTPLHTITINNKTDSIWIKREQLAKLLVTFISTEITETNMTPYFKETSFNDLTLNAVTLTYDPKKPLPDSIPLTHWDVYIDPENGKIQKIYLVKQHKNKADNVTEQLTWQTDKSATINTLIDRNGTNTQLLKVEKFIWNFNN